MLVLVNFVDVDTEEWIRQKSWESRVREVEVDDERYESSERWRPAPLAAANVGILRPDDAVMVRIPIFNVLLNDLRFHVRQNSGTKANRSTVWSWWLSA